MLTQRQVVAIKLGRQLAVKIQNDFPQIAEMYRNGMSRRDINLELKISTFYKISHNTAEHAIMAAIAGYEEGFDMPALVGLIPDEKERQRLGEEHNRAYGVAEGQKSFRDKTGIFSLPRSVTSANAKKHYAAGKALAAFTTEERREHGRRAAVTRGQIPWIKAKGAKPSEEKRLLELCNDDQYKKSGRVDLEKVRLQINREYHRGKKGRTILAIRRKITKLRGGK